MSRPLRVAVLAGEASGDILGAGLMRALPRFNGTALGDGAD